MDPRAKCKARNIQCKLPDLLQLAGSHFHALRRQGGTSGLLPAKLQGVMQCTAVTWYPGIVQKLCFARKDAALGEYTRLHLNVTTRPHVRDNASSESSSSSSSSSDASWPCVERTSSRSRSIRCCGPTASPSPGCAKMSSTSCSAVIILNY